MEFILTPGRAVALAAELREFIAADPESRAGTTLQAYLQAQLDARADAAIRRFGTITPYAFVERFTPAEYEAARQLAESDALVAGYFQRLKEVTEVRLFSDTVTQGLTYLESKGVLAAGRAAAITSLPQELS